MSGYLLTRKTLSLWAALVLGALACSSTTPPGDGGPGDDSSVALDSGDEGNDGGSDCLAANDCIDACFNSGTVEASDVQSCINDCCTRDNCPSAPDCFSDF